MNLALFHFIRPYWLLAFIPWLLLSIFLIKRKLHGGNWAAVCDEELLPYILEQKAVQHSQMPLLSMSLASFLTILALAGPTWERIPTPAFRNESGLVIALDLSNSMQAEDIKPSRLVRARYKIADILKARKDGQTALLVYSGDAFTVTPLTNDNATIASQLEALTPEIMPSAGKNTVLAVEKAADLLKQAGLRNGQVLLVTDGMNADEESEIVQKLETYQLSVLAVGTEQGAPISVPEGGFLKDDNGAIVMPKLPAALLQNLAKQGHGIYQEITDDDSDIQRILKTVDNSVQNLTTTGDNSNNLLLEKWDEKGVWLLLLILPLVALNFRRGLLSLAFIFLLPIPKNSYAVEWQDLWKTKDQQAYSAYQKGDYDKAAKLFQDPAWQAAAQYKAGELDVKLHKNPTTATGFYNQGNAFAKAGLMDNNPETKIKNLENALKSYDKSLKIDSNNQDAKHNKEIVKKELEKLKQQQQNQNQNSENSQNEKNNQDNKKQNSSENKNQQDNKNSQENKDSQKSENKPSNDNQNNQNQNKENNSDNAQQNQEKSQQTKNDKLNSENKPQQSQNQNSQNSQNLQNQQQMQQAKNQPSEKPEQAVQALKPQDDEKKQADEQWLNRIPDDPAGLLRRKFEYQYKQHQR